MAALLDRQFDVVLCDYFIAASEGFAPFMQSELFQLLVGLLRPGGLLLVVGQQPEEMMCIGAGGVLFAEMMKVRPMTRLTFGFP